MAIKGIGKNFKFIISPSNKNMDKENRHLVIDYAPNLDGSKTNVVFYVFRLLRCRILSEDKIILISADVIILIMIIFSILLFNEMIILNICGLGENTKEGFLIKEKKELNDERSSQFIDDDEINKSECSYEIKK